MAVRARRTVALKTPQLLDNSTSNYRKQLSGPVTPAVVSLVVTLGGDRRNIAMVIPLGESETPDPVMQRGPSGCEASIARPSSILAFKYQI